MTRHAAYRWALVTGLVLCLSTRAAPEVHPVDSNTVHDGHDHAEHEAHDHAGHDHETHADHDAEVLKLSPEVAADLAIEVREATGGSIERQRAFPAEVLLNRDRLAAVKPRFSSLVRVLHAEIGDSVRQGAALATLENRETLAVYTVEAPHDGLVLSKNAAVGELVGEDTVLYEVADLSVVWVDLHIFPQYQHDVRKGQPVSLFAPDGHQAQTVVNYISPLITPETRTIRARCILENPEEDFRPGAFVQAWLAVEAAEAKVRVERDAVQDLDGEPTVFVESPAGYAPRAVTPGLSDGAFVEIREGLQVGERYVARGAFHLKADMLTRGMDPHAGHGH